MLDDPMFLEKYIFHIYIYIYIERNEQKDQKTQSTQEC